MATSQPAVLPPPTSSGTVGSNGSQVPPGGHMAPPAPLSNPNGGMPNGYMNGDGTSPSQQVPQGGIPPPSNGGPPPSGQYGSYPGGPYQGGYPPVAQKPMMPPSGSAGYPGGPRFPSGQSISQQGGPTPTLNSLLQNRGGSNGPPQTGPPNGPPPPGGHPRMPPATSQSSQSHPPGPYGPPPPNSGYPGPWGGPNEGSNYYRHPQGAPPRGPPYGHPQQQPYPYHPQHQMSQQHQAPPSGAPGAPPGPSAPGYAQPPGAGSYGSQNPRYPGHPGSQPPNNVNTATSNTQGPPTHPGQDHSSTLPNNQKPGPTSSPSSTPSAHESSTDDGAQKNDPRSVTPSGLRPTPSPTGSSSSRSMSPAVGGPGPGGLQSGPGGQQMPPRPPSNNQAELGTNGPVNPQHPSRMSTQAQQPGGPGHGYPPNSQSSGPPGGMGPPPHHMMYGGGKPGSSQQMPPYGGQPPYGHYGPRGPGGPPGAYGGYPGSQYGRPGNPPPGPYPGYPAPGGQQHFGSAGPHGQPGWPPNSSGPPSHPEGGMTNNKSAPPGPSNMPIRHHSPGRLDSSGGPPTPHGHPHPGGYPPNRQPHPQHMMGKPGYPPHPQGSAPNSYNGPPGSSGPQSSYNGPEMPPPISGSNMPPHPPTGAAHSYPGSYPNSSGGGPSMPGQHPSQHPQSQMNTYGNNIGAMNSNIPPTSLPVAASPSGSKSANSGPMSNNASSGGPIPVTGPDGLPMHDETSQQSTLSQSSDRSDGRATPSTKGGSAAGAASGDNKTQNYLGRDGNMPGGYPSQAGAPERGVPPGSPHSSAPSPGGSMGSSSAAGEDGRAYPRDIASPGSWQQRTTSSPVHSGSTGTKSDNMMRLYELDDNPDRRLFLDKLLHYMEERGTPLTQCPTISKQPLDLYRLYHHTKERGGYLECTKSKAWKEIAAQLGIGASSSGAYTLKKHYGKNLLAFECQFDRGGIDPAPILAQVEAAQNKGKKAKAGANNATNQPPPAPSPGSQDSRDSTSFSSSSNQTNSEVSYPSGPGYGPGGPSGPPPPSGLPPGAPGYNNYPPSGPTPNDIRPASHPGYGPPGPGYGHYPPTGSSQRPPGPPQGSSDHYPSSAGGYPPPSYPPNASGPRGPSWPPQQTGFMGPPGGPPNGPAPPPSSSAHDMYNRQGWPQPSYGSPRPPYPGQNTPSHASGTGAMPASGPPSSNISRGPPAPPAQHPAPSTGGNTSQGQPPFPGQSPYSDQYQSKLGNVPGSSGPRPASITPGAPPQVSIGPGIPVPSKPAIIPSAIRPPSQLAFGSPVSSAGPPTTNVTPSPSYPSGTKPGSMTALHAPPSRPAAPSNSYPPYSGPRPPMYPGGQPAGWQHRYQSNSFPSDGDRGSWGPPNGPRGPPPPGQWGAQGGRSGSFPGYGPKPPMGAPGYGPGVPSMRPQYRPEMRGPGQVQRPGYPGSRSREMSFPPGSVESTPPLLLKRRKYTKVDVQPVDGWRLVMSLRSGLLMESSWALDVINVLLYDDHSFTYFGLGNMPGLLEALLEHWRATLISMFEITEDLELGTDQDRKLRAKRRLAIMGEKHTKKRKCSRKIKEESDKEDSLFAKSDSENEEEDNATDDYGLGMVSNNLTNPEDKCVVLSSLPNGQNFSKRPRFGEEDIEVISKPDELFIMEREQEKEENNCSWDLSTVDCGSGSSHWLHGGGNPTDHIITSFTAKHTISEFVRVLKESKHLVKLEVAEDSVNGDVSIKPSVNGDSIDPSECKKESNTDEIKPDRSENNADGTNQDPKEDIVDKIQRLTGIVFRDPDAARKRWHSESLEDENYMKDEPSLHLISDCHDNIGKRAVCISTILRNLSFVPGNEYELSKSPGFLAIVGKLLLLHYWYPQRTNKQRNYDRGEDEEAAESCTSLSDSNNEWWWSHLHVIRENIMVALANIAGSLDLSPFDEDICRPILNGLLEWAVSSSAYAQDPFPNVGRHSPISPQRLAIEALCKLSLSEFNVDLILSTPPYTRIEKLTLMLAKKLYRYEDQVLREFSINLLYYLSAADSGVARTIALSDMTVALLLGFIEQAEQNAMVVAQQHGVNALRDNPDSMGTSLDMLRRAASTLGNLSKHPDNVPLFLRQEQRLLALVMSQILDQGVASILSNVLFNIGSSNSSDRTTYFGPKKEPQISTTKKQNEEKLKQEVANSSEGSITAANA